MNLAIEKAKAYRVGAISLLVILISFGIVGTNPLCFVIPSGKERHIVLDMSTSAVSGVKILLALEKGGYPPKDGPLIRVTPNSRSKRSIKRGVAASRGSKGLRPGPR